MSRLTGNCNGIIKGQKADDINFRNFHIACRFAQLSNVSTVLLTGKGEPTLYPDHITNYLAELRDYKFPFIELQTNGLELINLQSKSQSGCPNYLQQWHDKGLTTVSLSCVDFQQKHNKRIFGQDIELEENVKMLHRIGFSVRISCVMIKGAIDRLERITNFAYWCKENKVEQFTVRPATSIPLKNIKFDDVAQLAVYGWIKFNEVEEHELKRAYEWFDDSTNATLLLELAHGARVYDYNGQNISLNSCLTRNPDPDKIRQLIFSSDGHLRFDWIKQGAIIL